MTGGVSLTTSYAGNASMGAGSASGWLWLTAPVIYPNEQRKRRNTFNEFGIYDNRHTIAAVLSLSPMTVKRSLNELENAGLIMWVRQGVGEPNRIYVLILGKEDAALA